MLVRQARTTEEQAWEAWWVAAMRWYIRPWWQKLIIRPPREPGVKLLGSV